MTDQYLDIIDVVIVALDTDAKITLINRKGYEMLGYKQGELEGKNWFDICLPPEEVQPVYDMYLKIISGEITPFEYYENKIISKNGDSHLIAWRNKLITDETGKTTGTISSGENITDRKKAEVALNLKQFAFDNAGGAIFWVDSNAKIVDVNNAACKMLGYTRQELLQYSIYDFDPNYKKEVWPSHFEELRQKESLFFETEQRNKDGKLIPVEITANYINFDGKELNCAFVRDITKRKQTEELLKLKQFSIDNAEDAILWITPDAKIIDVNKAACHRFGYTKEEFSNFSIPDINSNFTAEMWPSHFEELRQKGSLIFEAMQRTKKGRLIPVEITANYIKFDDKEFNCAFSRDITIRKQTDQEINTALKKIEDSERKYKFIYESNPMPMAIFDTETLQFLSVNDSFIIKYGYSKEEIVKMSILDIRPDSEHNKLRQSTAKDEKGTVNAGVWTHKKKNGELIQVEVIRHDYNFDNRKSKLVLLNDVTEKIKAEQELIFAKDKAEESDRLKSAFLANMSHEIRTPMNGILGFADLLKEPGLSTDEQQEYIEIIEKSGERMLNIINDIIDISKIESGLMEVSISESNINEQLDYVYTFFKPEVEAKGMQLYLKNTLPLNQANIKTDREKVFAILINLVKNAIKYSTKGTIEIGYDIITINQVPFLQFFVKDTGVGIPKNRQNAIFERFIQADISNKMAHQGAGLGLSITKAYVELLGGTIWVESTEGIGSTFYFTTPYHSKTNNIGDSQNTPLPEEIENHVHDLKILIAEDDKISEMLITKLGQKFSKEILIARTGLEAVEISRNNPDIDLILIDVQMPELNGHEATLQIREFNKDVIIFAQTAFGLSGDRETAIESGCTDYISKPIKKEELMAMIKKYFDN